MMDFYDVISCRRSVRSYSPKPVSKEKIEKIIGTARLAPSGGNSQPWKFIIVKDEKIKEDLISFVAGRNDHNKDLVGQAPVVIAACGPRSQINRGGYMGELGILVDVSIAATYLILAATAEGLGTCWLGGYDNFKIKDFLDIPNNYDIVTLITLGYPKEENIKNSKPKNRKDVSEFISYDEYH